MLYMQFNDLNSSIQKISDLSFNKTDYFIFFYRKIIKMNKKINLDSKITQTFTAWHRVQ